jgi:endonuclease YncB( thermonuclease family)
MVAKENYTFYSGGLKGAETAFGEAAEKWSVKEVNFTFSGQKTNRQKNAVVLSDDDLKRGDISMELVSKMMNRTYYETEKIRKVLQTIFHMVNKGHQVFVIGTILEDNTVKGGTGWAVELAKLFNRPLSVYDQAKNNWYSWKQGAWIQDTPMIEHETFVGSGTRNLSENGRKAIDRLFEDTFASL